MTWVEVPGSLPPGFAIGGDSITVDASGGAYQGLAQGETFTTHFDYDIFDEFDASVHQTATVTITGTNDAPVVSAAVTGGGIEATSFAVDLLQIASDVDQSAVLHVANVTWVEVSGILPARFATPFPYTTLFRSGGAYQGLAQGETFTTHFDYDIFDEFGASVHQTATVTITGTNDAPV